MILVSRNIRYIMRIFTIRFVGNRASNNSGVVEDGNLSRFNFGLIFCSGILKKV